MNQKELAEKLGMSPDTMRNIEHGKSHLTVEMLFKAVKILQCTLADLLKGCEV